MKSKAQIRREAQILQAIVVKQKQRIKRVVKVDNRKGTPKPKPIMSINDMLDNFMVGK